MDALFDPVLSAGLCGEGAAGRTYDTATQSFGVSGVAPSELAKNYYAYGGGDDDGEDGSDQKRQVRHVTDKMMVAAVPRGMKAEEAKRLKELELENARLKKLLAEAELDKAMLKEIAEGNF